MRNPIHRQMLISVLLAGSSFLTACTSHDGAQMNLSKAGFKLADGSPISDAAYDDYSPIIARLSNNYLALVFGSTRPCSVPCSNHNIFVALSLAPYTEGGILPPFNPPQPLAMYGTSGLSYPSRTRIVVLASGLTIKIFAQYSGGAILETNYLSPSVSSPIDVGISLMQISDTSCSNHSLLGADGTGKLIAANTAGTQVYRFDPVITSGQCSSGNIANPKLATGTHVSLVRQTSTGIADSFIVSDTAGKISAQTVTSDGPQLALLKDGLQSNNLVSTGVSVMQGATAAGDLITFSAAPAVGQKSDLYVLLSPKPAALWLSYVSFGQQPVP